MADTNLQPAQKRRARKWWLVLLAVPIVPLLYLASLQLLFELRLSSLRAAGDPTSIADAERIARSSVDVDCTSLWQQAMQAYSEVWGRLSEEDLKVYLALPCIDCGEPIPRAGTAWPELPVAIRCLKSQDRALLLCKEAAAKGGKAWLPRDRGVYDFGMMKGRGDHRMLCWLIEIQATVELYQKQPERAAAAIDVLLALARAVQNQPTVNDSLYPNKYEHASFRLIRELCSQETVTAETLGRFQAELSSLDLLSRFRDGLKAERACAIDVYFRPLWPPVPPYLSERMGYLDAMDEFIQQVSKDWPHYLANRSPHTQATIPPLTELAINAYRTFLLSVARVETNRRMTIVAIAVRRFIAEKGHTPASIDVLIPQYLPTRPKDLWEKDTIRLSINDHEVVVSCQGFGKPTEQAEGKPEEIKLSFELPVAQ